MSKSVSKRLTMNEMLVLQW